MEKDVEYITEICGFTPRYQRLENQTLVISIKSLVEETGDDFHDMYSALDIIRALIDTDPHIGTQLQFAYVLPEEAAAQTKLEKEHPWIARLKRLI